MHYELVGDVLNEFGDEEFHSCFTEIVQESGSRNVIPVGMPRVVGRQVHRLNTLLRLQSCFDDTFIRP